MALFTRVRTLIATSGGGSGSNSSSSAGAAPSALAPGQGRPKSAASPSATQRLGSFESKTTKSSSFRSSLSVGSSKDLSSSNPRFVPPAPPAKLEGLSFASATHQICGTRHAMEDFATSVAVDCKHALFAVFDGHGGSPCAQYFSEAFPGQVRAEFERERGQNWSRVLSNALQNCERMWTELPHAPRDTGTVAAAMLISGTRFTVAHVGDCGVVTSGGPVMNECVSVTKPHRSKDPEEQARIEAAGGRVEDGRILGVLAPSRAFGNIGLKQRPGGLSLSSACDVVDCTLTLDSEGCGWILLASDGCFDVMSAYEVHKVVNNALAKSWSASAAAKAVASHAARRNVDDITVTVILFGTKEPADDKA